MLEANGKVKTVAIVSVLCAFFAFAIVGLGQTKTYKVTEFDPKVESDESFDGKAALFARTLAEADKSVQGYVNLYTNDPLSKRLTKALSKYPEIEKRINLQRPGVKYTYRQQENGISFWIGSDYTDSPFSAGCVLCDCPTLAVDGERYLFDGSDPKEEIVFTANTGGGADVTFAWTVSEGTILKGQGTWMIEVKPSIGWNKEVTATVEIGGLDPNCNCPTTASFTTAIRPD